MAWNTAIRTDDKRLPPLGLNFQNPVEDLRMTIRRHKHGLDGTLEKTTSGDGISKIRWGFGPNREKTKTD